MKHSLFALFLVLALLVVPLAGAAPAPAPAAPMAAVSLTGGAYTENFDTLATPGTTGTALPAGWASDGDRRWRPRQ